MSSVTDNVVVTASSVGNVSADTKVPFHQLCQLLEKMHKAKNNVIRKDEFVKFLTKWRDLAKNMSTLSSSSHSFYPALRLILPQTDKERLSYGVKEVLLAKLYIDVLGLAKNGQDAKKLLEYRNPKTNTTSAGDFAEVAYQHVLSKRCGSKGNLTIAEVNDRLDKIASHNNEKKKDLVRKTLLDLIRNTSAVEQKWLIRMMLKDLKLRLGQKAILLAFHPDAEEVYNVTTSLKQVCERLPDPSIRLSDKEIELFQPFRPMLALNAKLEEVEKLMGYKQFSVEIKYDGERSQLHKQGNQYKYFSRSGKEYSSVFGETLYNGTLSPHIHQCFHDDVISCILDGEMMGYHPEMKIFMQKGNQFDIKHVTEDSELQPCLVVFDMLYLNGKRLTSTKQSERIKLLYKYITPLEGRLQFAEVKQSSSNQEVVAYLNEAIDRREEGIIVKEPESVYAPNKRKGSGWFKIKPEYAAGVVDDLDLVIIGGSFGSGRRGNFLSMFHLGVAVKDTDNPTKPATNYLSFCKVGSGYTNKQLMQIIEKLKPNLRVYEKKKPPDWLKCTKEKPEVYIHPQHSLVVQVRGSEIIPSSAYATGNTLRFPRLVAVRDDKEYEDAMDTEQLENLKNIADGKLAARHASLDRTSEPVAKKRKVRVEPLKTVSAKYQGVDLSTVAQTSSSFEGKVLCVISASSHKDKQKLERRIAECGGDVVQNPTPGTFCVVAKDEHNLRVKNAIRSGKYDVVRLDWLLRCLDNSKILPWKPTDMFHATQNTMKRFKVIFDKFGDEYCQDVTQQSLKDIFDRIDEKTVRSVHPASKVEGHHSAIRQFVNSVMGRYQRYGFADSPTNLLIGFSFFLFSDEEDNSMLSRNNMSELQSLIWFYGGTLHQSCNDVSHVIVTSQNPEKLNKIFEVRKSSHHKFKIISEEWLRESVCLGEVLDENQYAISKLNI